MYYYVISEDMHMAIIRTEDDLVIEHTGPWALEEDCENYFNRMVKWYEEHPDEITGKE